VRSQLGPVEILVANGGGPKPAAYTQLSLDDWDAGYRITLRSMLQLIDGVLPRCAPRNGTHRSVDVVVGEAADSRSRAFQHVPHGAGLPLKTLSAKSLPKASR